MTMPPSHAISSAMSTLSIDLDDSERQLIPKEEQDHPVSDCVKVTKPWSAHRRVFCLLNVIVFGLNLVWLVSNSISSVRYGSLETEQRPQLPLPAREAIKMELRSFKTSLVDNRLAGTPRPELEAAWHDLLQNDNIRVSKRTLDDLHLESVLLKDNRDVLASLSVFHALHCLKKVRQMTYKEHYHAGKDEAAMVRETAHSDHCIEYIREYLQCKPDLSFITYHWINNTAQNPDHPSLRRPTTWDHAQHECANWDALNDWAGARRVDLYRYEEILKLPDDGLLYRHDEYRH